MEILEGIVGFIIPFVALAFIWKGAKEDWKKA